MNRFILVAITVASTWIEGAAIGNEQVNLLDPPRALDEARRARVAFLDIGNLLLQKKIDLPTLNDMVELPELSLRTRHLYAQSDPGQDAEGAGSSLSKTTDKIKLKKKKPSEDEFANLPFKQPNEPKSWRQPLGWTFVGVGGAAIISGTGCLIGFLQEKSSDNPDSDKVQNLKIATIVLESAGAVILITGIAFLLWEEYEPIKTEVAVGPGYAGMSIKGSF